MVEAKLVVAGYPCTACQITNDLNIGTLEKVASMRPDFRYDLIIVNHPKEIATIEGMEVETLPALLLDGEQVSAGSVLAPRQVIKMIDALERSASDS